MKKKQKVSAILVIYNEEKLIRRALESIKNVVDEILILHDGPCKDKSLKIAREYTSHVFQTKKNHGVPGMILPILFRKVKHEWILKIDADEVVSKEFAKAIPKLIQNPKINAYTVRWPYVDKNKKETTKNWPRKLSLYRKSKMHYLGFPHWDDPKIDGEITDTNFVLHHYPPGGSLPSWKMFREKGLGRYLRLQGEYTLKDFKKLDRFQYEKEDYPLTLKIRRMFPLITALPFGILAFFRTLLSRGAWREGRLVLKEALGTIIYYYFLGIYIYRLKMKDK
jgi:glycosyltransferase involved in cell wall biosynthesis